MKRLVFTLLVLLVAAPAFAQSTSFGVLVGAASAVDDGFEDVDLSENVLEAFIATDIGFATELKLKAGQFEDTAFTVGDLREEGDLQFLTGVVEYRFDEVFGSTGLFLGGGMYRSDVLGERDTEYGFVGGVNGHFPITRRVAFIAEIAYHNANFNPDNVELVSLSGGLRFGF